MLKDLLGHDRVITGGRNRRERGDVFLKKFVGDSGPREMIFWAPLYEFTSAEDANEQSYRFMMLVHFRTVGMPADNKWLGAIGAMVIFHYVFIFALRYACKVQGDEVTTAAMQPDDDELLGTMFNDAVA